MTFKERFPSLKGLAHNLHLESDFIYSMKGIPCFIKNSIDGSHTGSMSLKNFFFEWEIEQHLLDKAKVKEAFEVIKSLLGHIPEDLLITVDIHGTQMHIKKTLQQTIELKEKELRL